MDGTISLGIYDSTGKLVRILHREATAAEFVPALDGFITHWDGLDDSGQPLPPGRYSARGYMVGALTIRALPSPPAIPSPAQAILQTSTNADSHTDIIETGFAFNFPNGKPFVQQPKIHVSLMANPLDRDRSGSAELAAGIDATGSWLQLADGLPLKQIGTAPNLKWAALGRFAPGEPVVLFQSDVAPNRQVGAGPDGQWSFTGAPTIQAYSITKVSNMMAFDCGPFDFAAPTPASASPAP